MLTRVFLATVLILPATRASAQLSPTTFGGLPLWADSALRAAGLDQRFKLSSALNPVYEFGDFDRDGLVDIAVEIKDAGGLRCGVAITHRIDRSVHIVGAGEPLGNGTNQLVCGRWGVQAGRHSHRHVGFGPDLLYVTDPRGHNGWFAWDGHSYVWIEME